MTATINEEQIQTLWSLLPHEQGTIIRWMAKKKGIVRGDFATSARELYKAAKSFREWDFYVAPNPTNKLHGLRHTARDVTHWSWFFLDIDPQDMSNNAPGAALNTLIRLLSTYLDMPLDPLIMDSGRGAQAWFSLPSLVLDEHTRKITQNTMRWWLHKLDDEVGQIHGCRLDTTCSDLPRVMRCPGTFNSKTGKQAMLINSGTRHPTLGDILIVNVPLPQLEQMTQDSDCAAGMAWQKYFPYLTVKAQTFLIEGKQEPGRHEAAWHTARKYKELGAERVEITKALAYGNSSCTNGLQEPAPLSAADIKHILDTADSHMV